MLFRSLLFALWIVCALTAHGQVLAPASDGHILRNETYQFTLGTGDPTGVTGLTYFAYFRDLYVGGENSFTYDFDPNDGISTHYNRELRSILEFNISSLNLTPGSFTAYLDLATDDNFYPVAPYTLQVKAANLAHGQEDGSLTQSDYSALDGDLDTQTVDGQNFPQNYSFNITAGLNDDLTGGGTYSGFILYSDALNGNEISFVSSYEQSQGGGSGPQLRIVGVQPDISVNVGPCQATLIGSTYAVPVEVTNAGSADLVVDEVFELQDSGNVYALDLSGFLTTLPSGESSSFAILFSPVSEGSFSGSFRITSNDPDESTYTFALNCLGISTPQPDIDVSSDPCTDTPVGGSSAIDVLVENSGTADLIISGVTESEDSFSAFTLDLDGFQNTISSGTSSTFKVRFNPITTGEQSAAYQISSNDPDQPVVTITVSCKAYASGQNPGIEVNPVPVVISGVKAGTSGNKIVTLKNTGEGTLTISSIDLSGS